VLVAKSHIVVERKKPPRQALASNRIMALSI
jgi:hypothetical protein